MRTRQAEQERQVRQSITDVIVEFYHVKMCSNNRRFWPAELRIYIAEAMGGFTPNSVERRLREARTRGRINYELVGRGSPECEYQVLHMDVKREDVRKTEPLPEDVRELQKRKQKAKELLRMARRENRFVDDGMREMGELGGADSYVKVVREAIQLGLETQDWKVIAEGFVVLDDWLEAAIYHELELTRRYQ